MTSIKIIQAKYESLSSHLDERSRRIWAATEAKSLGHGGTSLVSTATGIARSTIHRGIAEMESADQLSLARIRKAGGGRKTIAHHDSAFSGKLENLIEPLTRELHNLGYSLQGNRKTQESNQHPDRNAPNSSTSIFWPNVVLNKGLR